MNNLKQNPLHAAAMKKAVSPDPALQFVFATFAILTWLSKTMKMTPDAVFVMAILQISLGVAAYTGGRMNIRRGDPHGNINLILAVILGFATGLTNLASVFAEAMSLHFHPWILSVVLMVGGLYMLCFLPLMNNAPAYVWCAHLIVCTAFISGAFGDFLSLAWLKTASGWLLFVFALLALYQGVSDMYQQYGKHLPQGPKMPFSK